MFVQGNFLSNSQSQLKLGRMKKQTSDSNELSLSYSPGKLRKKLSNASFETPIKIKRIISEVDHNTKDSEDRSSNKNSNAKLSSK